MRTKLIVNSCPNFSTILTHHHHYHASITFTLKMKIFVVTAHVHDDLSVTTEIKTEMRVKSVTKLKVMPRGREMCKNQIQQQQLGL